MKLLKPSWVSHDGKPIFSIDIHPDGSRFATGGQGEDCGKIVVWNMSPVKDEEDDKNDKIPKILCQMDHHLACVNCVRWSYNGKYLASCGDDKLVMVWQTSRYSTPTAVFGSAGTVVNIEQWRPVQTLRSHSGDVLDLAWSPHDAWLATCSVDNSVIIWNALNFPEQLSVLRGHTGLVKGVTWDPVGKYIASQSDDKTVRIWRTLDWQQESVVKEPFKECGGTTHVLRLGWSPDAHYLVSAHAMNNAGPTAQIIERDGWKTNMDFVGHRKAITCIRFNPNILSKKKKSKDESQQYACCAIGSRDRSLSVWLTVLKRPLVVMHDLFTNSVLDVSWSKTGMHLLCCSWDGTVAYMEFDTDEIGSPFSHEEMCEFHENVYGKSLARSSQSDARNQVIETAAMLKLQQQQKSGSEESLESPSPHKPLTNGNAKFLPTDKQIETKTADGRRRITPIFLAPQPDLGGAPLPFSLDSISFTSSKEHSKIVVEKQDRVTAPGLSQSPKSLSAFPSQPVTPSGGDHTPKVAATAKTPSNEKPSGSSILITTPTSMQSAIAQENKEKAKPTTPTVDKPIDKDKMKDRTKLTSNLALKRKQEGRDPSKPGPGRPKKDRGDWAQPRTVMSATPVSVAEREHTKIIYASTELELNVPKIEKSHTKHVSGTPGSNNAVALEMENNVPSGAVTLHRLRCCHGGSVVWEHMMSSRANVVAGSSHVACVACEDQTVSIFSVGGRKILPSIVLNSRASVLECIGHYAMAISQKGQLFVWNLQSRKAVIKCESLSDVMSTKDVIYKAMLTKDGVPVIMLANHRSYAYEVEMGCWVLVSSKSDMLRQCSDYSNCVPSRQRVTGPVSSLQSAHDRVGQQATHLHKGSPSVQKSSTVSHLEAQMAACLVLKSGAEYTFWLQTYVRYLVQEGLESKLREVFDELLGPVYKTGTNVWQEYVLGIQKRSLLLEVLPVVATNLRLQRLYTEYQEQLDSLKTSPV